MDLHDLNTLESIRNNNIQNTFEYKLPLVIFCFTKKKT